MSMHKWNRGIGWPVVEWHDDGLYVIKMRANVLFAIGLKLICGFLLATAATITRAATIIVDPPSPALTNYTG
jgi:hypothetical protein